MLIISFLCRELYGHSLKLAELLTKQLNSATGNNTHPNLGQPAPITKNRIARYSRKQQTRQFREARLLLMISAAVLYLVTTSLEERSSSFSSLTSSSDDI